MFSSKCVEEEWVQDGQITADDDKTRWKKKMFGKDIKILREENESLREENIAYS